MGGMVLRAWPDGRSLLEQPALTVSMFNLMESAARLAEKNDG